MINFEKAKKEFDTYVEMFDKNDSKVNRKIRHTYLVVDASEYLSKALNLNKEDTELSKLIALLHDIGRFKQSEIKGKTYDQIEENFDHAEYGAKLLFEDKFIRKFIEDSQYDEIIYKAIKNHNKLEIEEGLLEKELLHAKLIRDNDKTGNIIGRCKEDLKTLFEIKDMSVLENDIISETVYNNISNKQLVAIKDRKTYLDKWFSTIGFIFDYNFKESIQYVYEKQYVDKMLGRITYKNPKTIQQVKDITSFLETYMQKI